MNAEGVLVLGYGNSLRTDDGIGWHAAMLLDRDPRFAGAEVLARHQLTPELADDVSRASLVVFIDAREDHEAPGSIEVHRIEAGHHGWTILSHHLHPATLIDLAHQLHGRAPPAFAVNVGVSELGEGDRLSPRLAQALPEVVETVVRVVQENSDA